jgi:hypothetical protein
MIALGAASVLAPPPVVLWFKLEQIPQSKTDILAHLESFHRHGFRVTRYLVSHTVRFSYHLREEDKTFLCFVGKSDESNASVIQTLEANEGEWYLASYIKSPKPELTNEHTLTTFPELSKAYLFEVFTDPRIFYVFIPTNQPSPSPQWH